MLRSVLYQEEIETIFSMQKVAFLKNRKSKYNQFKMKGAEDVKLVKLNFAPTIK